MTVIKYSNLKSLNLLHQGKVRDIYDLNNDSILIVTSDRLSAFDVIMNEPIPSKGEVLTKISNFWFKKLQNIVPNHLLNLDPLDFVTKDEEKIIINRSVVVKKLKPIPIEAIVRGYIIGSGWNEYQKNQSICNISLPKKLRLGEQLPEPMFTPSNKADIGNRDENISIDDCKKLIGNDLTKEISKISISLYQDAFEYAYQKGIIIADTKFEFGLDSLGRIHIMDEIFTPDSSRFWSRKDYKIGISPPSFDKQFVRDWLESNDWNKMSPPPKLPEEIIKKTSEKYQDVFYKLTGNIL